MISHIDQLDLFKIIAKKLSQNIDCFVFGGTAMMFFGYKDETKDIDVLFENLSQRNDFIKAIKSVGFSEKSLINIYIPQKLRDKNRPLVYQRENYRFDLFVNKIFRTKISENMKSDLFAVHEFGNKFNFTIKVLRKEHIVLLKAITERKNDFDDILNILQKEKNFNWDYLIKEAIWQHKNGDSFVILDLEKTLKELKKYVFIEKKYFELLYKYF